MARKGFLLVLEGLPGAGKTTAGQSLVAHGWKFYPEVATTLAMKGVPVGDKGNTRTDQLIFSEEMRRVSNFKKDLAGGLRVVADGYFPTDLAFAYARFLSRTSNSYPECLRRYLNAAYEGKILLPDMYLHFKIPIGLSQKRQGRRGRKNLTTMRKRLLENVQEHLAFIHKAIEPSVPTVEIDAVSQKDQITRTILKLVGELNRKA